MKIRKYKHSDRAQVEHINFETALLGKSMSKFLTNNKLYKNNIKYYVEKEPESIFILEDKKVVGYLLGCLDDKNNPEVFSAIGGNIKNFFKSFFLPKKDAIAKMPRFGPFFHRDRRAPNSCCQPPFLRLAL